MAVQSAIHQRRALELLAASAKQGCTEAFLLAHGFTLDLLTDMVRLASQPRKTSASAKPDYISLTPAGGRSGVSGMQSKRKPRTCRGFKDQ